MSLRAIRLFAFMLHTAVACWTAHTGCRTRGAGVNGFTSSSGFLTSLCGGWDNATPTTCSGWPSATTNRDGMHTVAKVVAQGSGLVPPMTSRASSLLLIGHRQVPTSVSGQNPIRDRNAGHSNSPPGVRRISSTPLSPARPHRYLPLLAERRELCGKLALA